MRIHDISLPISPGMTVWPGDPAVEFRKARSILRGDQCNVTEIRMGAHCGTHIDAPYHFFENGATTDSLELQNLIGPCLVVDLSSEVSIGRDELQRHDLSPYRRVLVRTRNSELWAKKAAAFDPHFTAVKIDAAEYLLEMRCALIGVDYLSIEAFDAGESPVHKLLLKNNIVIVEGLNLSEVPPGEYELICMPLALHDCDGAPARVVLVEKDESR